MLPERGIGQVRVLHIITRFIIGGAQENTISTVIGLDKNRYWVMLASGPASGSEGSMEDMVKASGIRFVKIPELVREIDPFKDIIAFFKLYKLIKKYRFDIVHTHTSKAGVLGRCAAKLADCPIIIHTPHGHLFYGHYGTLKTAFFIWLERAIARITSCIITLTEIGKKEHIEFGIAEDQKFRVVPSGIDIELFSKRDQNKVESLRKELGLSPDNKVVGTVARLVPVKGHHYFIDAAERVAKEVPQSRFMIIGDGMLKASLEEFVRKKNLTSHFYFLGLRSDIANLLALLDIVVLTSLNEGMGRVIVQAMASAKPVVATRVGGVPAVVLDGRTGLLVRPKDKVALAEGIISLLRDEPKAKSMGEAGRRRVKDIFSKEEMVRKIDAIYNEFLMKLVK